MFVADSMRFFRAPTTSIDSVNSAQMINKIEVLIRDKDMMMVVMQSTFCPVVVIFGDISLDIIGVLMMTSMTTLIFMVMKEGVNNNYNDGEYIDDGVDDTSPEVWLELFCEAFFRAEVGPRRYLNGAPVFQYQNL